MRDPVEVLTNAYRYVCNQSIRLPLGGPNAEHWALDDAVALLLTARRDVQASAKTAPGVPHE